MIGSFDALRCDAINFIYYQIAVICVIDFPSFACVVIRYGSCHISTVGNSRERVTSHLAIRVNAASGEPKKKFTILIAANTCRFGENVDYYR